MTDDAAVRLLTGAVSIASVSGGEAELAAWLHGTIGPQLDSSEVDAAGNYVATIGQGPKRLYFLGHIDTVPGEIPVRVEAGELWGRGSVDAKGSFVTSVAGVLRAFAQSPDLRDRLSVTLIGAVGEETPHSAGARHALSTLPAPDLLVICEPSGWQSLTIGYKGRLHLTVAVNCPAAHSAGQAPSAADCLLAACTAVRAAAEAMAPDAGPFKCVQMNIMALNSVTDGLEQQAEATLSFRLPPGITAACALSVLTEVAEAAAAPGSVSFKAREGVSAVVGSKDSELSRAFRNAIRLEGGRPSFKVKTGTSDWNVVAPVWQVPTLAYGPGDSGLDHAPDERLALDEYLTAVGVVAEAVSTVGIG